MHVQTRIESSTCHQRPAKAQAWRAPVIKAGPLGLLAAMAASAVTGAQAAPGLHTVVGGVAGRGYGSIALGCTTFGPVAELSFYSFTGTANARSNCGAMDLKHGAGPTRQPLNASLTRGSAGTISGNPPPGISAASIPSVTCAQEAS